MHHSQHTSCINKEVSTIQRGISVLRHFALEEVGTLEFTWQPSHDKHFWTSNSPQHYSNATESTSTLLDAAALATQGLVGCVDQGEAACCKLSVKVKHHNACGPVAGIVIVTIASFESRTHNVYNATQSCAICGKRGARRGPWAVRSHPKYNLLALCSSKCTHDAAAPACNG